MKADLIKFQSFSCFFNTLKNIFLLMFIILFAYLLSSNYQQHPVSVFHTRMFASIVMASNQVLKEIVYLRAAGFLYLFVNGVMSLFAHITIYGKWNL